MGKFGECYREKGIGIYDDSAELDQAIILSNDDRQRENVQRSFAGRFNAAWLEMQMDG